MKLSKAAVYAASALILSACASNNEGPTPDPIPSGKGFIKVAMTSSNGELVRAGEENISLPKECNVKDFTLAFYDKDGVLITQTSVEKDIVLNPEATGNSHSFSETVEIPLSPVSSEGTEERKVVCYLNVGSNFTAPSNLTETTEETSWINGANFVMSNSVYFNTDGDLVKTSKLGKIFNSKTEAANATGTDVTEIYVERLASKTRLTDNSGLANMDQKGYTANEVTDLKFAIDKWALTATATKAYMLKQFGDYTTKASLNELLQNVTEDNRWYVPAEFRTHWAVPVFFKKRSENALKYLSYQEVFGNGKEIGASNWDYCLEHAIMDPANAMKDNTSVLIAGHYTLSGTIQDLFTYGQKSNESTNDNPKPYLYIKSSLLTKIASDFQIKKGAETATAAELESILEFTPKENSASIVAISLKAGAGAGYTVAGKDMTQENLDARASNMPRIRMYKEGKGYYWVPIQHFGVGAVNGIFTGSYGVIRNIAYDIEIQRVNKLAAPIADPESPVVPEEEDALNYLQVNINILNWKLWYKQGAILGK